MFEEMKKALGWFRELERLGTFDQQTGFRCGPGATKEQAESVISELVAHIEVLKTEWESFGTNISDPGQEEVVRAFPNDLKDFYLRQLLPNEPLLVRAYVGALIRQVRANHLRLINLSQMEEVLAKHFPDAPDRRYELAVVTHRLSGDLQDISAIVDDFGKGAEQALDDFDTSRVVRDQLIPVARQLFDVLPEDYLQDDHVDLPLDVLQMQAAMQQRYASHLRGYAFSRSLTELLARLDSGPDRAAQFLSGVLDYWYDLASDEDRFGDGGKLAREGERHKQKLYALCKREAVWQLLDKPFFRPEKWQSNLLQLQPIVFENQMRLNSQSRHYVVQVYKSFVFGQWSAVFALARALLEDVVKDRLKSAGGEVFYEVNGRKRDRDFYRLVDDLVRMRPELEGIRANMDYIREQGNKALHDFRVPRGSVMVDAEQRFRFPALEVIRQLKLALEALFGKS
jgi:hypothetical protein